MSWIIFYLASTECGSDMKRKVDWDDEENEQSSMELSEETSETEASDEEDSSEEEPRIKDVLENLSQTVSRKRASDLLHSMAASKDILFWTPRGKLLRNKRIIPVTNIAELVEYILLPHNDDVTKPRALNTFLDGLAELGVDKRLIKNKKILSELLEKEKAYRENENEADDDSDSNDSNDSSDQEQTASEQSQSESIDGESDSEPDHEHVIQKKSSEPCHHCQNWNVFASAVVKCPSCFWHDNCCICPVCGHEIPVDTEHVKESFYRCYDCGALKHENFKTSKVSLYSPSEQTIQD